MTARAVLPLIDLVFLTLGVIMAVMTQMEHVTALPVELARVAAGAAITRTGELHVLTVDRAGGLALDGAPIPKGSLAAEVGGLRLVVRADRRLPAQTLLATLADAARAGAEIELEVDERERAHGPATP